MSKAEEAAQEAEEAAQETADETVGSQVEAEAAAPEEDLWGDMAQPDETEDDEAGSAEDAGASAEEVVDEAAAGVEDAAAAEEAAAEAGTPETPPEAAEEPAAGKEEADAATEAAEAEAAKKTEEGTPPAAQEQPAAQTQEEWMAAVIPELEKRYILSEDEAVAFSTEPESVIPKLAAKLHAEIFASVVQAVGAGLPGALQNIETAKQAETAAAQEFYDAWPDLNDDAGTKLAERLIPVYLQANPGATRAQVIQEVGASAMVALRRMQSAAEDSVVAAPEVTGTAPAAETGGIPANALTQPHRPVGSRTVSGGGSQPAEDNPFVKIAEEFIQDDNED